MTMIGKMLAWSGARRQASMRQCANAVADKVGSRLGTDPTDGSSGACMFRVAMHPGVAMRGQVFR